MAVMECKLPALTIKCLIMHRPYDAGSTHCVAKCDVRCVIRSLLSALEAVLRTASFMLTAASFNLRYFVKNASTRRKAARWER